MTNIYTRSPFIIEIDEASQTATKVELYISTGTDTAPTSPTYTLSKLIPSSNITATQYNVSPYIREYMTFDSLSSAYDSDYLNVNQFAVVTIKRYKDIGAGYVLVDEVGYYAFDGYGYYEEGSNFDNGSVLMTPNTYYYNYDSTITLTTDFDLVPSSIGVALDGGASEEYRATYTNLVTGASVNVTKTTTILGGGTYLFPRQFVSVWNAYYADGNKVEIFDNVTSYLLATYYFYPKDACKYTPIKCDFVNKFGQYQRLWFYAASNETLNVTSNEYNTLQTSLTNYNTKQGQKHEFNLNGSKSIKVNTDWVDESFNLTLKELMLSEKILIDNYPAKLKTKSTELFKNINTKMINYALEFDFNYNVINDVI
jgi:hypothetical protein